MDIRDTSKDYDDLVGFKAKENILVNLSEFIGEQIEEPKALNECAAKICNGIKIFAFALVAISVVGGILVYVLYI